MTSSVYPSVKLDIQLVIHPFVKLDIQPGIHPFVELGSKPVIYCFVKPLQPGIHSFVKLDLQPGTYFLKLKFTGILNDELRGFYRTKYTTPCRQERNGALTHFEATGARRAFPCFDEPSIRATFDITLVVPKDRLALSNMVNEPLLKVVVLVSLELLQMVGVC